MAGGYWNLEAAKPKVLREFLFHRHGDHRGEQHRGEPTSADLSIIRRLSKRQLVAACYAGVLPLGTKDNGRLVWPALPSETAEATQTRCRVVIEEYLEFRAQQEEAEHRKIIAKAKTKDPHARNIHFGPYPPDHPIYNDEIVAIITFTHPRRIL
jgi:hypothetical protein